MNLRNHFLLFIAIFLFIFHSSGQKTNSINFVQLCDTQLGMGGYEHDKQSFSNAVSKINALHPDFVIICGDLVNTPTDSSYKDFLKIKKQLMSPCYCVPGNHDVGNIPDRSSLAFYRKKIGKDYFTFHTKDYSFIAINTQLYKTALNIESDKQNKWLQKTLKTGNKKGKSLFIFGHFPLYVLDPMEKENYFNLAPDKRKEILALLERYHVKAYLSGHSHTLILNNYKGTILVSGETTSNNFDKRPFGFRWWTVSPDSITHRFVAINRD